MSSFKYKPQRQIDFNLIIHSLRQVNTLTHAQTGTNKHDKAMQYFAFS